MELKSCHTPFGMPTSTIYCEFTVVLSPVLGLKPKVLGVLAQMCTCSYCWLFSSTSCVTNEKRVHTFT